MRAVLMLTNCDSIEQAEKIADTLLARKLAAAIQIIGPADSRYRWRGKIQKKREWTVLIKTSDHQETVVSATIKSLHTYQLPGILKIAIESGERHYLQWILRNSSGQ